MTLPYQLIPEELDGLVLALLLSTNVETLADAAVVTTVGDGELLLPTALRHVGNSVLGFILRPGPLATH